MKKKDPALWVVVDSDGDVRMSDSIHAEARKDAAFLRRAEAKNAPFRVVKYVPAPKRKRKA